MISAWLSGWLIPGLGRLFFLGAQWGSRVGADVSRGEEGADPSSVVFDGLRDGLEREAELILVDTAGRLHTQTNLMDELKKVGVTCSDSFSSVFSAFQRDTRAYPRAISARMPK